MNNSKPVAKLDIANHRYVIKPLDSRGQLSVGAALRAIKETHTSWRAIAEFCGIQKQSAIFKATYGRTNTADHQYLSNFLTISGDTAYFYDKNHQPATVNNPEVHPTISNKEDSITYVTAGVPAKVTTRVVIDDPIDRSMQMSITAKNGVIIGTGKLLTSNNTVTVYLRGNAARLNHMLQEIEFVGAGAGNGTVIITVDDLGGQAKSVVTATVNLKVAEGKTISTPVLNLPEEALAELNKSTVVDPSVTVADKDGKMIKLRISPFGCDILGFANYLGYIKPGEVRTIYGDPESINKDIAGMKVRAYQDNAQIGFELTCGNVKIRKYLVLTVIDGSTTDSSKKENVSTSTADSTTESDTDTKQDDSTKSAADTDSDKTIVGETSVE